MKTGTEHRGEYRIVRPDGEVRWITCKGAPVFDDRGSVIRLLGILQDITERKLAEERLRTSLQEKEVLLREIHHRVKNNLQVVSSLLSLQAMQTPSAEASSALMESCRRIQVMADIHNRLYGSSDIAQIEFDVFVNTLAKDIIAAYASDSLRIDLEADLEPVTLDIDAAIPCSLIISELLSNAIKHAFPGKSKGTVAVALKQRAEKLHLRIRDSGSGMPEENHQRSNGSLGLKLVHALVEQLDGEIIFSNENGTSVSITFAGKR
jgi:two-component sensor histidine kinase